MGEEVREGNPSPGNKAGGITTLEEKSLGCIHKGGHTPVNAVYDYAKQVEAKQGLVIMDTPGNDPSSVAAMVAGGAQIVVFSSGRGTPTGLHRDGHCPRLQLCMTDDGAPLEDPAERRTPSILRILQRGNV